MMRRADIKPGYLLKPKSNSICFKGDRGYVYLYPFNSELDDDDVNRDYYCLKKKEVVMVIRFREEEPGAALAAYILLGPDGKTYWIAAKFVLEELEIVSKGIST